MHFSTIAITFLFGASTMAVPAYKRAPLCLGIRSSPQCCAANELGLADLNCEDPPTLPSNISSFVAVCASIGQQAQCCTLPVLGQALVCGSPPA